MPDQFTFQDQVLVAGREAVPGVKETLNPATQAIRATNLRYGLGFEVDQNAEEHRASLDEGPPIVQGGGARLSFGVRFQGPGTGGAVPEFGDLIRGCGFAEEISAADETGTAQAGSANTITLALAANATDDFYRGKVIELTGGTGAGQSAVVASYVGATKVATINGSWTTPPDGTTTYSVPANVLYKPASIDLDAVSFDRYESANQAAVNSTRSELAGARGSFTLELGRTVTPALAFTFTGIVPALPSDVARPTPAFAATKAPAYRGAVSRIAGVAYQFPSFTLDLGARITLPDDPAQAFGADVAQITGRAIAGRINPYKRTLATLNPLADFVTGVSKSLEHRWGGTAGNRFSLFLPDVQYNGNPEEGNQDGARTDGIPFKNTLADQGLYMCFF